MIPNVNLFVTCILIIYASNIKNPKRKEGFIPIAMIWEDTTRTKPSFKDYYIEKELSEKLFEFKIYFSWIYK